MKQTELQGYALALVILQSEEKESKFKRLLAGVVMRNVKDMKHLEEIVNESFDKLYDKHKGATVKAEIIAAHLVAKNTAKETYKALTKAAKRIVSKNKFSPEDTHKIAVKAANDFYGFEI